MRFLKGRRLKHSQTPAELVVLTLDWPEKERTEESVPPPADSRKRKERIRLQEGIENSEAPGIIE